MSVVTIKGTEPQKAFLRMKDKYPAFVAGFGTGKSEVMADSALLDSMEGGAGSLVALYEPTYDLTRLILAPRLQQKLDEWGVRYTYNKSDNEILTSSPQFGDFIMRTLDNPERIVGYESFRSKVDELDTLKTEKAEAVWQKIIARNRQKPDTYRDISGKPMNTVSVFSTPEGFRFLYNQWVKKSPPGYAYIQASTHSNPFLPDDYIQSLRDSYPPQLIEAYLEGQFVNLASGSIYADFDRKLNHSPEKEDGKEPLFIGMDFNVNNMSAIIHVKRGDKAIAVDEIHSVRDTPAMVAILEDRYAGRKLNIYPDSSGDNNKSNCAGLTDISQLRSANFTVRCKKANPRVRDRINCVNAMVLSGKRERKYYVNTDRCPITTDCLEQQVFDKNGEPDKKSGNDHSNDALGYFLAFDYPIKKPVQYIPTTGL